MIAEELTAYLQACKQDFFFFDGELNEIFIRFRFFITYYTSLTLIFSKFSKFLNGTRKSIDR